MRYGNINFQIW